MFGLSDTFYSYRSQTIVSVGAKHALCLFGLGDTFYSYGSQTLTAWKDK